MKNQIDVFFKLNDEWIFLNCDYFDYDMSDKQDWNKGDEVVRVRHYISMRLNKKDIKFIKKNIKKIKNFSFLLNSLTNHNRVTMFKAVDLTEFVFDDFNINLICEDLKIVRDYKKWLRIKKMSRING